MKRFLILCALCGLCGGSAAATPPKPNILLVLADDLGRTDVGFMGCKEIRTPHLDKLAHAGAVLDAFYVQPVCSPTRSALMTGRYVAHTGVYGIVRPHAAWGLPLEERTLAQALREAGYETAIAGKWHLGEFQPAYRPTKRGFDHQYGHWFGAIDYFKHERDGTHDWHRDDQPCNDEGYSTHLLAKEACRRIREKQPGKPLFLYLPFNAVHGPYQVPDSYLAPYGSLTGVRRTYAGMVSAMDEAIGQVVAALEKKGLKQNTLVIFSSDNGGPNPGKITTNGPLRAGKGTIYEGGIRVCAFASWPGRIPAGTIKEPIHAVDWYPTLLKLAGASLGQKLPLDGLDIWPVLTQGAKSPHAALLLCGTSPAQAAVRMGDWKLLMKAGDAGDAEGEAKPAARKAGKQGKRAARSADGGPELYNLADDIGETKNLAAAQPEKAKELREKLEALLKDAVPPGNANLPATGQPKRGKKK
ncbi:MAG: arylsulfatase [Verrucomicrobia bacterium]|nr:arylsulfatase [Verrucomicrobiota bacterium]